MAVVRTFGSLSSKLLFQKNLYACVTRNYCSAKDYLKPVGMRHLMPGQLPQTEEEHRKAAEKYNMHPDEYKPIIDTDHGYGDYPDLPEISADAKDPFYPWDYPGLRSNFGETLHKDFDILGHDRLSVGVRDEEDLHIDAIKCVLLFSTLFLIWYICPNTKPSIAEKQYPGKGKTHYTFEPAH